MIYHIDQHELTMSSILLSYTSKIVIDSAAFYCPYIPLHMNIEFNPPVNENEELLDPPQKIK